jgi:hypothetical protein
MQKDLQVPEITFPSIETENTSQQTIEFDVIIDSSTIKCAITYEALYEHFDAEYSDPLFAFMSGRSAIESIVIKRIKDNQFNLDEGVLIQSSDLQDIGKQLG